MFLHQSPLSCGSLDVMCNSLGIQSVLWPKNIYIEIQSKVVQFCPSQLPLPTWHLALIDLKQASAGWGCSTRSKEAHYTCMASSLPCKIWAFDSCLLWFEMEKWTQKQHLFYWIKYSWHWSLAPRPAGLEKPTGMLLNSLPTKQGGPI